jgi:hypothetical protein
VVCSCVTWYFSQPTLGGLHIILPDMSTITVEARWICDSIIVHPKSFNHQSTKLPRMIPTLELKCCLDFILGFCKKFLMQLVLPIPYYSSIIEMLWYLETIHVLHICFPNPIFWLVWWSLLAWILSYHTFHFHTFLHKLQPMNNYNSVLNVIHNDPKLNLSVEVSLINFITRVFNVVHITTYALLFK